MKYAEVILPLPLHSSFTYAVPEEMDSNIKIGSRVGVPFGLKKYYTGIVISLTPCKPEGFQIKELTQVLDSEPIIRHPQLKFWEWIADYYLCAIGDVYKAAIPSGLKLESETYVELSPDFNDDSDLKLTQREAIICQILDHNGRLTVGDIEKKTGLKLIGTVLSGLLDNGMVIISEKLTERYRPKKESYVKLTLARGKKDDIQKAFDSVKGARKQEKLLLALIELSCFNNVDKELREVRKAELLERSETSPAILAALVQKGIAEIYSKEINHFKCDVSHITVLPKLSEPQNAALQSIHKGFFEHNVMLLRGVTSSGKTELYMHLIDFVIRSGKQALYLVPEIALTTQLTRRLQKVFGSKVIIYHSKFTDNERVEIWRNLLRSSSPCVVIGARSSVFLPFARLGLVIVDEEHESSYKQYDPAPRYNARDAAIVLATMHGAKVLLGSATPSIETYYKANEGKYGLVELTTRYGDANMPHIKIVDILKEYKRKSIDGLLSDETVALAKESIKRGEQIIFFHNRRGFAALARCRQWAYLPKCVSCVVSLTYHRHINKLVWHYCGASYDLPTICPVCKEPSIEIIGYGTERVEEQIQLKFPDSRILRMDLDTTRNKDSYERIITDFSTGKSDILIGTQMVTKGLDFGGVSMVGVLNADSLINFPDFRSGERAFNMLMQVSGRAGRRQEAAGTVVIQTSQPEHPIIGYLTENDYTGFYKHELKERKRFNYPPFTRIINIYIKHRSVENVAVISETYGHRLRELFGTRVYGPDEPAVSRIQSLYIRKLMLKIEVNASMKKVKAIMRDLYERMCQNPNMRGAIVYYDVDPL